MFKVHALQTARSLAHGFIGSEQDSVEGGERPWSWRMPWGLLILFRPKLVLRPYVLQLNYTPRCVD